MAKRVCGIFRLFCLTLVFAFFGLTLAAPFANAEGGEYNFGSMQGKKMLAVEPGKTVETRLYFFNIHGNRDTHIEVALVEAPAGFKIELLPERHNATYNISGQMVTTQENLVAPVTPLETLPLQKPETAPAGVEYVTMGGIEGFVPARYVTVRVTAPEDAPLWQSYKFQVSATAGWFDVGEIGPVGVKQARDFFYEVRTMTTQFSEAQVEEQKPGIELDSWMLATIALGVIVIALIAYLFFSRKKKR